MSPKFVDTQQNFMKGCLKRTISRLSDCQGIVTRIYDKDEGPACGTFPNFKNFLQLPDADSTLFYRLHLFPDQQKNLKKIFQCTWYVEILCSTLFGSTALKNKSLAQNSNSDMQTIFMHSSDTGFEDQGEYSKIDYKAKYNWCKHVILDALRTGGWVEARMLDLFDCYNRQVFADGKGERAVQQEVTKELSEALNVLNMDSEGQDKDLKFQRTTAYHPAQQTRNLHHTVSLPHSAHLSKAPAIYCNPSMEEDHDSDCIGNGPPGHSAPATDDNREESRGADATAVSSDHTTSIVTQHAGSGGRGKGKERGSQKAQRETMAATQWSTRNQMS
ncbi:hypothetical protein EST38_g13515 [Candolleomyces aberdarensis]|uniref:Uncharacterized protein n=1 Tax=Candolleomyces aberdarensis TaxID=2316362 RepID=A0A4V1Q1P8_9AGAR|nr:hypothetical protein EST38_g13515 [Candolleomyces aberdarensis]